MTRIGNALALNKENSQGRPRSKSWSGARAARYACLAHLSACSVCPSVCLPMLSAHACHARHAWCLWWWHAVETNDTSRPTMSRRPAGPSGRDRLSSATCSGRQGPRGASQRSRGPPPSATLLPAAPLKRRRQQLNQGLACNRLLLMPLSTITTSSTN